MTGDDRVFRRDEVLGGLPARRATTLLYAIEQRTQVLVRRSRTALATFLPPKTSEEQARAFYEALAAGRGELHRPTAQDLERYAPDWADLVPPDIALRAALARFVGEAYRLTPAVAPGIRAALGLDDPAVADAFERLHGQPLSSIWAPSLTLRERLAWRRAGAARGIETLPPFWMAYFLTLTETVGQGAIALPVALAGLGPLPGVVLLVVFGLVNVLTIGSLSEAITRNGSMRWGQSYFGRLVSELLGRAASRSMTLALLVFNIVTLVACYLGFASVLTGATGIPEAAWVGLIFAANLWYISRGRLDATVASALVIGAINIGLVLAIAAIAATHVTAANLTYAQVPLLDGQPLDPQLLQLVFGVVLVAYFGHTSAANAAKVVLDRDGSGRALLGGNMAALATTILIYSAVVLTIQGALGPAPLLGSTGTALTPLADLIGPSVTVLGVVFTVLALGLGSVYQALGLSYQLREALPEPGEVAAGLRRSLALGPRGKRIAGALPTVGVFLLVEALLVTGTASFAGPIGILGTLTAPLLAGVFPMLLVLAARRRGDYVPGRVIALLGHPVTVVAVASLFVLSLFVYGLFIWEEPVQRILALAMGAGCIALAVRTARLGAYRPEAVVELRKLPGRVARARLGIVVAGRTHALPVRLEVADPDPLARIAGLGSLAGSGTRPAPAPAIQPVSADVADVSIEAFDELREILVNLAGVGVEDLKVWTHEVTADGDSLRLDVTVEVQGVGGNVARTPDPDGHSHIRLPDGAGLLRVLLPEHGTGIRRA